MAGHLRFMLKVIDRSRPEAAGRKTCSTPVGNQEPLA